MLNQAKGMEFLKQTNFAYLKWGEHDNIPTDFSCEGFPASFKNGFDLIIASDVIYLPECVEPLFQSMKFFLKPEGKCLLVSAHVRLDGLDKEVTEAMESQGLYNAHVEEIKKAENDKSK